MKQILFITLCFTLLLGCKTQQQPIKQVPVETKTKIVTRFTPVAMPADSASMTALFECDSNYKVLLKSIAESKTKSMKSDFNFSNGKLSYNVKKEVDTIFVKGSDTVIYKETPVEIPAPYEVNKLTEWQIIQIWFARIALVIILLLGLVVKFKK